MNTEEQISHLNNSVWCKIAPSPIQGVGVFSIRDIPKGTRFWSKTSYLYTIPLERFGEIQEEIRSLILDRWPMPKGGRSFLSPNDDMNILSFMNHSNTPNSLFWRAIRDIQKGEEITENYRDLGIELDEIQKNHYNFIN